MPELDSGLILYMLGFVGVTAVVSGVITWAMARRYGRRQALAVPIVAALALAVPVLRAGREHGYVDAGTGVLALVLAVPMLLGAALGLVLSRRR